MAALAHWNTQTETDSRPRLCFRRPLFSHSYSSSAKKERLPMLSGKWCAPSAHFSFFGAFRSLCLLTEAHCLPQQQHCLTAQMAWFEKQRTSSAAITTPKEDCSLRIELKSNKTGRDTELVPELAVAAALAKATSIRFAVIVFRPLFCLLR